MDQNVSEKDREEAISLISKLRNTLKSDEDILPTKKVEKAIKIVLIHDSRIQINSAEQARREAAERLCRQCVSWTDNGCGLVPERYPCKERSAILQGTTASKEDKDAAEMWREEIAIAVDEAVKAERERIFIDVCNFMTTRYHSTSDWACCRLKKIILSDDKEVSDE